MSYPATTAWNETGQILYGDILTDAPAHALWVIGERMRCELAAEIERLRGQLDAASDHPVMYCLASHLDEAAADSPDAIDGTILRATDSGRELERVGGEWVER